MVTFMYNGEVAQELEMKVLRQKRFSTVKLAGESDMNSSFNRSALGAIASCEGGKGHGEMGLLCGESTLRRCLNQVISKRLNLVSTHCQRRTMATYGVGVTTELVSRQR